MRESITALSNILLILKFRLATTSSPTAQSPRSSWLMQQCGYCRECSATNYLRRTTVSAPKDRGSKRHSTRDRRNFADGKFQMCCFLAITQRLLPGEKRKHCDARAKIARIF